MLGRELLQQLVRLRSVNPSDAGAGELEVAEALEGRLAGAGLSCEILRSPAGRPSLVARLPGPRDRPPLVLLSHTDVVPVEEARWTHDPFGGEIVDGQIWGRGTLDMKGVAVMHAEAAAALADGGPSPSREVIVLAVADEEAGGAEGAGWLVREHADRVGFHDGGPPPEVLGEGAFGLSGILPRPVVPIAVAEKAPLGIRAVAAGDPGHGSMPPSTQAILGLTRFVEQVSGAGTPRVHPVMRDQFEAFAGTAEGLEQRVFALLSGAGRDLAARAIAPLLRARSPVLGNLLADTITPTQLQAGYKINVVPGHAEAAFDARLLPDTDPDAVLQRLRRIGRRHGIRVEEIHRWSSGTSPRGALFDAVADVSSGLPGGPLPVPSLTPGTTDLRFFRARGAACYGWVPLVLTPELLATFHGDDERVPLDDFDRAVEAMTDLVARVTRG